MAEIRKSHRSFVTKIVLLAAIVVPAVNVHADQVTFANGDRISGLIIHVSRDEIQILTDYAGIICADFGTVVDMNTDISGKVTLMNGDVVTGTIQSLSPEFVVIESQEFGALQLPRDRFDGYMEKEHAESQVAEPGEAGDTVDMPQAESKQEKKTIAVKETAGETPVPDYWSGSIAVGAQLKRGNSDTTDVRTDIKATRKAEREELNLRFYAIYGETEGETDQNEVFGQAKLKIFVTDRLYLFGTTDMEYDEMKRLDLRAQAFGGLGYKLINRERTTLSAEAGAGLTGEFFDDNGTDETLEPSVILGAEFTQKLFEHAVFYQGITLFPSLAQAGEFRVRSETSLTSPLGGGWAVKLMVIDDYDSDPEGANVKNNDVKFISAVEYTF